MYFISTFHGMPEPTEGLRRTVGRNIASLHSRSEPEFHFSGQKIPPRRGRSASELLDVRRKIRGQWPHRPAGKISTKLLIDLTSYMLDIKYPNLSQILLQAAIHTYIDQQ